jgi:putative membrane-bound dehydrogenase-like protein
VRFRLVLLLVGWVFASFVIADDAKPRPVPGPLSPREELATFRTLPGFRAELVACEPEVVDPVAMAFDERGRIFVAEMRGYPNGGRGTGTITTGRIKCLTDTNSDGLYETSTLYAEGLRFPTGVMPYKGGLLVANAPDLLYLEDMDDDGRSDKRRVLYTGFGVENIQQLLNSLQWGLDNWVHGCAGSNGGTVTCPEKPDFPALTLRNRHVRFHPDMPGSLEPASGGGQYGLSPDAFGRWFTATNSQHLRHIVLPDHYLRRNPFLSVPAVVLDIPDHGAACQVFRVSSFEAWRVERTSRRLLDPRYANWPSSEKVPGGFVTSGCSPVVYTADLYPPAFRGNTFVCDPANNLIHRDKLVQAGGTFVAKRVDDGCEFLASSDNWFRPVHLTIGPDGALYVLDFYREAIETPLSLPDDIKAKMNLESRGRGRIWRIGPDRLAATRSGARFDLRKSSPADLVAKLGDPNSWWRFTAQRVLVERQDRSIVRALEALARTAAEPEGRVHALRTLEGLHALAIPMVELALADASPDVREHALQLSEAFLSQSDAIRSAVLAKADDPNPRVRFQAAFSVGGLDPALAAPALVKILRRDGADPWAQTASLSSAARCAPELLTTLAADPGFLSQAHATAVLRRLATVIGAQADPGALARAFKLVAEQSPEGIIPAARQAALLDGLGQGLQNSKLSLRTLWEKPPPQLAEVVHTVRPMFERAAATAADEKAALPERVDSVRLLGFGPFAIAAEPLANLLSPRQPPEIQSAVVRALAAQDQPQTVELLLAAWDSYGPSLRREVVEALLARPARVVKLLDAIEANRIAPTQLEVARRDQLRKHANAAIRQRAVALFANVGSGDRRKVVEDSRGVLDMTGDAARGKPLFQKHCAVCHKLDGEGHEVGPDLRAVLGNKTREALLTDALDPNREVDPRYVNYQVTTTRGRVLTGLLAAETPASVTLRRAENAEDTILRSQIESMQATGQSLMPDEFEKQVSKQDLADIIEFLLPSRKVK